MNKATMKALGQLLIISLIGGLIISIPLSIPALGFSKLGYHGEQYWESLPKDIAIDPLPQRSRILDANGDLIAEFYSENRVPVTYEELPDVMKDAIISVEDERFYEHGAVDLKGTLRAVASTASGDTQGGSTLSQQFVKNTLLYRAKTDEERSAATEVTAERKIEEMSLAAELESEYSKDEILTGYLNIANFGDRSFGVGAASLHYFGVEVGDLKLEQAALLAGIVNSPEAYNPVKNPDQAEKRRNVVLARMLSNGKITQEEHDEAVESSIELNVTDTPNGCASSKYPFFCSMVRSTLTNDPAFGSTPEARERLLYLGGLTIHTTLDPKVQEAADKAAKDALGADNEYASSIAVVEPGTGQIKGIGTNKEWGDGKHQTQVNLATSEFQNGSTYKPITLAAALENGWGINQTLTAQSRFCAPGANEGCFTNMASYDAGTMNAVDAMAISSNTFFTQLSVEVGTDQVQDMGRRLGLPLPDDLHGTETSTTLGTYEVSTIDLANAYATFAAHGRYCNPTSISKVTDASGEEIEIPEANCHQELSPDVADKVAMTLTEVVDGNNPHRTGRDLDVGRQVMAKSGTTDASSAVWFAGGTPQYQTAVWVGDPQGGYKNPVRNLRLYGEQTSAMYGSTAAGPLWEETVKGVHKGVPEEKFSVSAGGQTKQASVIPDVRGMTPETAVGALEDAGYSVAFSKENSKDALYRPNTVVKQSVAPGDTAKWGEKITLTLSKGSDLSEVSGS